MAELGTVDDIERRLRAVHAVRQVIQAIWAIARAQLPLAEAAAAEAAHYLDWVDRVIDRLAGSPVPGEDLTSLLVVIGPERAFSGALPGQILDGLPATGDLGLVGTRLGEIFEQRHELHARLAFRTAAAASVHELEDSAGRLATFLLAHRTYDRIELLHPREGTSALRRLVLLSGAREILAEVPETYSPPAAILDAAVRESIQSQLVIALAEALRAEVRARIAMAEQSLANCDRKDDELEAKLRVLRQEAITSELCELSVSRLASHRQLVEPTRLER